MLVENGKIVDTVLWPREHTVLTIRPYVKIIALVNEVWQPATEEYIICSTQSMLANHRLNLLTLFKWRAALCSESTIFCGFKKKRKRIFLFSFNHFGPMSNSVSLVVLPDSHKWTTQAGIHSGRSSRAGSTPEKWALFNPRSEWIFV